MIRDRRELIGLSQSALADALQISKSLLSRFESGERQPTEEQIAALAQVLGMPPDLLMVATGRLPQDVLSALGSNPAEAVAAVRQRIEAQPMSYPRAPIRVLVPTESAAAESEGDVPERIDVRKTSASYRAHSYHTKVPPEAIRPFIRAYTNPGETVFDPFCGSGMTGVAALMENRHGLLSDFSPAAVHIARNYTTPCDPDQFAEGVDRVSRVVAPTIAWLYRPTDASRLVEYTTWSDVFRCPACFGRILYWEAFNSPGSSDNDGVRCPQCATVNRKSNLEWTGEEAVQSHTSQGSSRIDSHVPTRGERALIEEAAKAPIPYWTPDVPFGSDREMWRAGHRAMAITSASDFFTRRNLHALAALRHAIISESEGRVREALMFAFTAAVNRASRRYQWNAKRPTNVMTGTLYVSSLRYEWNVWSLFRRKASDVLRYYRSFPATKATAEVFQRSATDLSCLPDRCIDLIFMDPPFGANIFYADSSLLWDAWLGQTSDQAAEIVVNKHRNPTTGGKTIHDYGELMTQALCNAARVLKLGGRAVLAFSNSDDQVWKSIQSAIQDGGFKTTRVHILNKGQPSIKGVKGASGKENVTSFDMMLCLAHRSGALAITPSAAPPASVMDQVIIAKCAIPGSRNDEIYSAVVQTVLSGNYSLVGITMPAIAKRCEDLGATIQDGRWVITQRGALTVPDDFLAGYIARNDLPIGTGSESVAMAMPPARVPGSRGSAFYLAHSYHTKVPPEAISPFIEFYTKPGDVVLDPFCGSGMTGVAATLLGRRSILNDLSPAAIHLTWNHTRPCDPDALAEGFAKIEARIGATLSSLYRTVSSDGADALIYWTLWSTKHQCSECTHEFLLWETIDRVSGRLGNAISCPACKTLLKRSQLEVRGSVPSWIAYGTPDGGRAEKAPSPSDIERALSFKRSAIDAWYPEVPLGPDREMYVRCALQLQGIKSVADFYTPRNLYALALIWREISIVNDDRVRRALAFAFTNTAWHGTRMRRFNARGGQRPLTGTLYIPQLSSEVNVFEVLRNKIASLKRYYRSYQIHGAELPAVTLGSATNLDGIPDGSIDYVFTDPPFGSNIFYADCNLIWESWLGRLTNVADEAVVNRSLRVDSGGKSLAQYSSLIAGAMREIARVLKPGGWATVVFHSTDAAVWQVIRVAAESAGFSFHEAASLDRQQQSHKGYKGRSGAEDVAHFDVIFNLRKSIATHHATSAKSIAEHDLSKLVASVLEEPDIAARGLQAVHAEVMRRAASTDSAAFVDYSEVREIFERLAKRRARPDRLRQRVTA